ncbi:hypothetical protein GCM10012285_17220 [Streptomyces kronopolitis]|uniref:Uncharacterized protein n=1 Tax=Streptomyces kronopolitis TaxID=1612435 RepID=A0ABQ2J434_9ACTN|nr:hypothetical protein GCM10012285_17220 [Streptomyces kronopolitis]
MGSWCPCRSGDREPTVMSAGARPRRRTRPHTFTSGDRAATDLPDREEHLMPDSLPLPGRTALREHPDPSLNRP